MDINAIIAAKKFCRGGGGSIPKPLTYDYMPDGYPYADNALQYALTPVEVVQQRTTFYNNGENGVTWDSALLRSDKTLKLQIGDTAYPVTMQSTDDGLGFKDYTWIARDGETVVGYVSNNSAVNSVEIAIYNASILPTTLSLYLEEEIIVPLDEKFLPESVKGGSGGATVVVNQNTFDENVVEYAKKFIYPKIVPVLSTDLMGRYNGEVKSTISYSLLWESGEYYTGYRLYVFETFSNGSNQVTISPVGYPITDEQAEEIWNAWNAMNN